MLSPAKCILLINEQFKDILTSVAVTASENTHPSLMHVFSYMVGIVLTSDIAVAGCNLWRRPYTCS